VALAIERVEPISDDERTAALLDGWQRTRARHRHGAEVDVLRLRVWHTRVAVERILREILDKGAERHRIIGACGRAREREEKRPLIRAQPQRRNCLPIPADRMRRQIARVIENRLADRLVELNQQRLPKSECASVIWRKSLN